MKSERPDIPFFGGRANRRSGNAWPLALVHSRLDKPAKPRFVEVIRGRKSGCQRRCWPHRRIPTGSVWMVYKEQALAQLPQVRGLFPQFVLFFDRLAKPSLGAFRQENSPFETSLIPFEVDPD